MSYRWRGRPTPWRTAVRVTRPAVSSARSCCATPLRLAPMRRGDRVRRGRAGRAAGARGSRAAGQARDHRPGRASRGRAGRETRQVRWARSLRAEASKNGPLACRGRGAPRGGDAGVASRHGPRPRARPRPPARHDPRVHDEEVAPLVDEHEKARRFPTEVVRRIGELGWLGINVPERWGGAGMDTLAYAIAVEEIGRVWGSLGLIVAAHTSLGCGPLLIAGTDEQRDRFLPPLASGAMLGAYGLTEPMAGSDAGGTRTTAPPGRRGLGHRRPEAVHHQRRPGGAVHPHGANGIERRRQRADLRVHRPGGRPGFSVGRLEEKMGLHASATGELQLDGVRVPAANLLGEEGAGFKSFLKVLDGGRISIAALALGLAQAALDAAVPYAKKREQFGRPIGSFQGVAFMIADMATEIEAARALVYRAAWLKDQGRDYGLAAAQAKLFASEVSVAGHQRRDPGPRRLRLHRGLQGRALPAGREADRDRGGDEPGPAARDRAPDPRAADRLNRAARRRPAGRGDRDRGGTRASGPRSGGP